MTLHSLDRLYQPAPLPEAIAAVAYRIDWTGYPDCCLGLLWVVDLLGENRRPCPECVTRELAATMIRKQEHE